MTITQICPHCGKREEHEVPNNGYEAWKAGMNVQDAMPEVDSFTREFLITGACFDCISKIFHRPKPGDDWGEVIGECECCGSPLYARDGDVCPCCGTAVGEDEPS